MEDHQHPLIRIADALERIADRMQENANPFPQFTPSAVKAATGSHTE